MFGFAFEAPLSDFVIVGSLAVALAVFELRMRFSSTRAELTVPSPSRSPASTYRSR